MPIWRISLYAWSCCFFGWKTKQLFVICFLVLAVFKKFVVFRFLYGFKDRSFWYMNIAVKVWEITQMIWTSRRIWFARTKSTWNYTNFTFYNTCGQFLSQSFFHSWRSRWPRSALFRQNTISLLDTKRFNARHFDRSSSRQYKSFLFLQLLCLLLIILDSKIWLLSQNISLNIILERRVPSLLVGYIWFTKEILHF